MTFRPGRVLGLSDADRDELTDILRDYIIERLGIAGSFGASKAVQDFVEYFNVPLNPASSRIIPVKLRNVFRT